MNDFISKNTYFTRSSGDLIMQINSEANKQKSKGKKVINGSIGMLFDDDSSLASFSVVDEYLKKNIKEDSKKYDSIIGNNRFQEAIISWLFHNNDLKDRYCDVIGTMGATGALAVINKCFINNDEAIILPSIRWGNYDSIAYENNNKVMIYNLFKDGVFDIDSLKEQVNESCLIYKRAVVLINDPCQNPSGYSLSNEEWDEILSFLKMKSKEYPIVLVDDIAYLNFYRNSYRDVFQKLIDASSDRLLVTICFSSSKTLQIYGLRGGALITLTSSKEVHEDILGVTKIYCRSTWSSPNHLATNVMGELFLNESTRNAILKELAYYRDLLYKRAEIFIQEAKRIDLNTCPYKGGFFIFIEVDNNIIVAERLMKKGLFIVPMSGGIRISIASIPTNEISGIAKLIKEAIY